jgi:hypothetical protein
MAAFGGRLFRDLFLFLENKLGIDKAIFFVLAGRGITLLSQPITLLLIGRFLSPSEQGFYFTFANIVFISILLELGLGTIITQFASHEFAHLHWMPSRRLGGEEVSLARILSLARKAIIWYLVMSTAFALIVIPLGIVFFESDAQDINYKAPWMLLVAFSAVNLVIYAFTAFLEGCAKVADIQLLKMFQSIAGNIMIWLVLFADAGLFAAAAMAIVQAVISLTWIRIRYYPVIQQIFEKGPLRANDISWKKEVLPLQWRIALSWIAGYIIAQTINPALFKFRGPVEAGQMGMTISIANVAAVVGLAWVTTKAPGYGSYIKLGKFAELSQNVRKNTLFALFASVVVSVIIAIVAYVVKIYYPTFGVRFLSIECLVLWLCCNLANLFTASIATYLRAFKAEPFLYLSLLSGALQGTAIVLCAKFGDTTILCWMIFLINFFFNVPYAIIIFRNFERGLLVRQAGFRPTE